jgi:hypothetical protein
MMLTRTVFFFFHDFQPRGPPTLLKLDVAGENQIQIIMKTAMKILLIETRSLLSAPFQGDHPRGTVSGDVICNGAVPFFSS